MALLPACLPRGGPLTVPLRHFATSPVLCSFSRLPSSCKLSTELGQKFSHGGSCTARSGGGRLSSSGRQGLRVSENDSQVPSDSSGGERELGQAEAAPLGEGRQEGGNVGLAVASAAAAIVLFLGTRLGGGGADLGTLSALAIPYDEALRNGRPTVVEFYADWCEVCRELAGSLYGVEAEYKDKVNFVMLNIDNVKWAEELNEFGVEGIPHFVFLDAQGNEEGNIVGKLPKKVLQENLSALARGDPKLPYSQVVGEFSVRSDRQTAAVTDPRAHGN